MSVERKLFLDGDAMTFVTVQDVEPILEHNKVLRSQEQKSDWGRHIASIPLNIVNKWLTEEWDRGNTTIRADGPEMEMLIAKKLSDPDWAELRVDGISSRVGY